MSQPWVPPSGFNWNDITMLIRQGLGHDMTIPEGDQNKTDANNAINWLGQQLCAVLQGSSVSMTGDIKQTLVQGTITGWLDCDHRTMGSDSSGSTLLGVVYKPLYEVLWVVSSNSDILTSAGGSTTKGASADDDWSANKRLYLPDAAGRALVTEGIASGGSINRLIYSRFGNESFTDSRVYTISGIAVTGDTPAIVVPALTVDYAGLTGTVTIGVIPFTSTNTYTPTGDVDITDVVMAAGAFDSGTATWSSTNTYTPTGNVAITGITLNAPAFVSGTATWTSTNTYIPTGAVDSLILSGTGTSDVLGYSCSNVDAATEPLPISLINCTPTPNVDINDIASGLDGTGTWTATNSFTPTGTVSITGITMAAPTFASGTGTFTATNTFTPTGTVAITNIVMDPPTFVSGTVTWTATNTFTPSGTVDVGNPSVTFGGTAVTIAGLTSPTALSGVTATGVTDANPLTTLLSPPSLTVRTIIKL